jgi:hypothetical protein
MSDVQPVETEAGNDTDDEYLVLAENGYEPRFNDYGYGDLLWALRKGYELGKRDGMDGVPWRADW